MLIGKKKMKFLVYVPPIKKKYKAKKKGQSTIIAGIFTLIALVVLAYLAPFYSAMIDGMVATLGGDEVSQTLIKILLPLTVIGVSLSWLWVNKRGTEVDY